MKSNLAIKCYLTIHQTHEKKLEHIGKLWRDSREIWRTIAECKAASVTIINESWDQMKDKPPEDVSLPFAMGAFVTKVLDPTIKNALNILDDIFDSIFVIMDDAYKKSPA